MLFRYNIFFALILMAGAFAFALDPETKAIMPFVDDLNYCRQCHTENDFNGFVKDPARACDTYCLSCHKKVTQTNHHPVGIKMPDIRTADMAATKIGKIACITCHNLRERRFDSKPWMAQSLFDSMFKKQRQYKTYYLILQNDSGQLCRTCH